MQSVQTVMIRSAACIYMYAAVQINFIYQNLYSLYNLRRMQGRTWIVQSAM